MPRACVDVARCLIRLQPAELGRPGASQNLEALLPCLNFSSQEDRTKREDEVVLHKSPLSST